MPSVSQRVLLSLVVAVHLLAMAGSALRYTPVGPPIRELTRPYEQLLGVHQTWPMFGVAPRSTHTLHMSGLTPDGTEVALPSLGADVRLDGVLWRYQRRNKLMRNAVSRKPLRASFVRWQCRTAAERGVDLAQVVMRRHSVHTPPPTVRGQPRSTWKTETTRLETWNCKR
jgi:hypothetical protein